MIKNIILIISGLLFLITALLLGSPFEFLNPLTDIITTVIMMVIIIILFILLLKLSSQIKKRGLKWLTIGLISLLAIPYFLNGLWIGLITFSYSHPRWQDTFIYSNKEGEKVVSQWRRTSGSIYDYRDRKILAEFKQFRFSINCDKNNLKGLWYEFNIDKNSTSTINFEKKK